MYTPGRVRDLVPAEKARALKLSHQLAMLDRKLDLQRLSNDRCEDNRSSLWQLFKTTPAAIDEASASDIPLDLLFEGFLSYFKQSRRRKCTRIIVRGCLEVILCMRE